MSRRGKHKAVDGETYICTYPHLKKWINQCICCQAMGYKPNMPRLVGGQVNGSPLPHVAKNIQTMFKPLYVNDLGLCEVCEKHHDRD